MRSPRNRLGVWALALGIAGFASSPASACPNCREALSAQPEEATRLANGFNWSILVMIGVPACLASAGGLAVRRAVRRGVLPEM